MTSVSGGAVSTIYNVYNYYISETQTDLPVTVIVALSLVTVLPLFVASHTYSPLLDGELRGVKERVSDVSPDRGVVFLSHR